MDSGEKLLTAMWRGNTVHQIATIKNGVFNNIPINSIPEAIKQAKDLTKAGFDVYFACAEFETTTSRKADNALGAWGYWFDIDCGEAKAAKGAGYTSKKEAYAALINFIKQTNFPTPDFIVDSGNGLHVYFCSEDFITVGEWKIGAGKLKGLAKHYGLLADPTRTADIASVLRFPNTRNYKDPTNPKEVKVKHPRDKE